MKDKRILSAAAILVMAGALAISGCSKKGNQQASGQNTAQGSAQTPEEAIPPPPPADQAGAQSTPQQATAQPTPPPPPPPPARIAIPAGTDLRVRLDQDLGSKINQTGDSFGATVTDDVIVNGQTVIPRGARAVGTVVAAKPLGRFAGGAVLALRLERVRTNWGSYPVATSTMERVEKGKGKRTALFAGGGGAFGALIGGLAGGGKGALIGALAGAGAGTAGTAFTGNREIFLPAETLITFRLERSVHVTE